MMTWTHFGMPKRARCEAAPSSDVAELLAAVQGCGGRLDGAEVADFGPTGLGLRSTRDLRVGDVLAHVPASAILCVATALRSRLGKAVATHLGVHLDGAALEQRGGVPARAALQLYLVACRHHHGDDLPRAHKAYAKSLPPVIPLPVTWPEQQRRQLLAGTDLERRVAQTLGELRRQYDACFPALTAAEPALFPAAVFTWPAFLWAHTVLSSRAFPASCLSGAEDDDAGDADACGVLIPILDVGNHNPEGGDLRWEPATCTMVLTRPVRAGAQIWSSYGKKPTASWLTDYGFAPWGNDADDSVSVRIGAVFSGDTCAASRRHKLRLWGEVARSSALSLDCALTHADPLPRQLLMAAHVCCLTLAQAAAMRQLLDAEQPSAAASAMLAQLLQRRIDALHSGAGGETSFGEQLRAAQSDDCVPAGLDATCAVTPAGASAAYRESCRRILLAAHKAARELCE